MQTTSTMKQPGKRPHEASDRRRGLFPLVFRSLPKTPVVSKCRQHAGNDAAEDRKSAAQMGGFPGEGPSPSIWGAEWKRHHQAAQTGRQWREGRSVMQMPGTQLGGSQT